MQIIKTKAELEQTVAACKRQGKSIGLVPTMGALHEGHASPKLRATDCRVDRVPYSDHYPVIATLTW